MKLCKYSLGIGDRFGQEAEAQLKALVAAAKQGIYVTPVWNKSFREHEIIKSHPSETRKAAERAVKNLGWTSPYFTDADHINLKTVEPFLNDCDFFTIDVADSINKTPSKEKIKAYLTNNQHFLGELYIPGIEKPYWIETDFLVSIAQTYLHASQQAKKVYEYIKSFKGAGNFITEVSMDEVSQAQSPIEIFFILGLFREIPLQTFAPRLTGHFFKGIDYVGDISLFETYFEELMLNLIHARQTYNLPENLKISIHSGSDKFSVYPVMRKIARKYGQGLHLKTAGTTWLEEVIGLVMSGGEALEMVKKIYEKSYTRIQELADPYKRVVSIDHKRLPDPENVRKWNGNRFANTLRHNSDHPDYNPHIRQLLHIGYKIAAEVGPRFIHQIKKNRSTISKEVTENILHRHIIPLFSSDPAKDDTDS